MEDDPFIIAQFHCQQLKCTRDKFGNVIDGSADSIQRVFYFWGLQQVGGGGGWASVVPDPLAEPTDGAVHGSMLWGLRELSAMVV
jgi:hypothetical protein